MQIPGFQFIPKSPNYEQAWFYKNSSAIGAGQQFQTYNIPRGASMINIICIAGGGAGGTGVVGAVSTAAGGGGGGGAGMTVVTMPIAVLPYNTPLYVTVGNGGIAGAGTASCVSLIQTIQAQTTLITANGGGAGGNAAGATAGAAGAAGAIATNGNMPIGWAFSNLAIAGQAGIIGGTTVAGAALTLPVTGVHTTGGTGGAGLGAGGANGTAGGAFTVPAIPNPFPAHAGGLGTAAATTPPGFGNSGYRVSQAGLYFYGGTGGGSTHGSATGAGLVQASGGNGGIGSGGGGMGGALTGSTAGVRSLGGDGLVIITCY